jgi:non-heme chloroperoxidase
VYGITRRGFGASDAPPSGYAAQRSAADVLEVLESLKLQKPILVGHSFGGQDLTTIGSERSDRVRALVYLNSGEDPSLKLSDYDAGPVDIQKLPESARTLPRADYTSFQAYREWQRNTHGIAFPESELRQTHAANANGSMGRYLPPQGVRDAIFEGMVKPDYAAVRVPVLALFPAMPSEEEWAQRFKPANAEQRVALGQKFALDRAILMRQMQDLGRISTSQIVQLAGANFYIFISNESEIVRELREFAARLK